MPMGKRKNTIAQDAFCQVGPHFHLIVSCEMPPAFVQFIMYIRQIPRCNLLQMLELNLPMPTSLILASADESSHRCSSSVLPKHYPSTIQNTKDQETSRKTCRNPGEQWVSRQSYCIAELPRPGTCGVAAR